MILAKFATPALLKVKIFQKRGYDVIVLDSDVTNKTLSFDSNCALDVVMWPKFGKAFL